MNTQFGTIDNKGIVTKEMSMDLGSLPSSDPLAFAYGINTGQRNLKRRLEMNNIIYKANHESPFRELAPEYLRGYLLGYTGILVKEGTKFRKGAEQCYFFLGTEHQIGKVDKEGKIVSYTKTK